MNIQLKRGKKTNFTQVTLLPGEPAFILDTGELFIGDETGKKLVNPPPPVSTVAGKVGDVTLEKGDVGLDKVDNMSRAEILASAPLTGSPTAPTPPTNDNSTRVATTAFVKSQGFLDGNSNIDGGTF